METFNKKQQQQQTNNIKQEHDDFQEHISVNIKQEKDDLIEYVGVNIKQEQQDNIKEEEASSAITSTIKQEEIHLTDYTANNDNDNEQLYDDDNSDNDVTKPSPRRQNNGKIGMQTEERSPVTVSYIQSLKINQMTLAEKFMIIKRGRPLPPIHIIQSGPTNNKKYIRSFNSGWYRKINWMCGCEKKHALFCFPCLLFGGEDSWSRNGVTNIGKLREKTEKHQSSRQHIDNVISLSVLGSSPSKEHTSKAHQVSIIEHNKKVAENRDNLSKIIDCVLYLRHFRSDDLENQFEFRSLVNLASKFDPDLREYLETSGISDTIQNEILDCLFQIYQNEIKKQIKEASFVALIADDSTDVSEHTKIIIIFRFMLNDEVFERFWGFFTPENRSVAGLSKCLMEQLDIVLGDNKSKLIAQTFDGAIFMEDKKRGVQVKIRESYNNAHFTHCYAHRLDIIMKNAASVSRNSRIFFSNIMAIERFFSKSPQRLAILQKFTNNSLSPDFNIRTVRDVYEHLQLLQSCLFDIQSSSNSSQTISEATGIMHFLKSENFMFWLEFFNQIMPHVEIIYDKMQASEVDVYKIRKYVTTFKKAILDIRNSKYCENSSPTLNAESKAVCDCISDDVEERYSFNGHLIASKLVDSGKFATLRKKWLQEYVKISVEAFPILNITKLNTELEIFYHQTALHNFTTLIGLLKLIVEKKFDTALTEIITLIKILLTIPMPSTEPGRCFSTLTTIKTFLRNTVGQNRLNALGMIVTEKEIFHINKNLKESAIQLFASNQTRRNDFAFK